MCPVDRAAVAVDDHQATIGKHRIHRLGNGMREGRILPPVAQEPDDTAERARAALKQQQLPVGLDREPRPEAAHPLGRGDRSGQ